MGRVDVRIAVFGHELVGKTLMAQYFMATRVRTEIMSRNYVLDNTALRVEIFDPVAQGGLSTAFNEYVKSADGFLIMYSVTDGESLTIARNIWKQILRTRATLATPPFVLVANKCEMDHKRVVSPLQGHMLAGEIGCLFFETSLRYKVNVKAIFHSILLEIIARKSASKSVGGCCTF